MHNKKIQATLDAKVNELVALEKVIKGLDVLISAQYDSGATNSVISTFENAIESAFSRKTNLESYIHNLEKQFSLDEKMVTS